MANIKPFKALRPQAQLAKQVASRPYDVLSSAEAKIEVQGNPFSFLHITKSEIDLPESVDVHAQEVYQQAKESLVASIQRDTLFRESKECYYIYQLIMNGRSQTGLVCVSSVDDYENDIIKKHEFTRPEKELDRINHIKTSGAQTGNVFLAYRNNTEIDQIIEKWKTTKSPGYDFTADDGIQHTIWIISDGSTCDNITRIFAEQVPCTYIADGHHRAASASKVRATLGAAATESSNHFLTTLFPSNQLFIMDYNRVVKDLNGLSADAFLAALEEKFTVTIEGIQAYRPANLHEIGLYLNKQWYKLVAKPGTYTEDPIGVLDVTILQDNILSALLNINDPRTDTRVDFVGGIRGLGELEKRVDSGDMAAAFSIYPVTMDQLFNIADSGKVMPPKSTWFEPKLRDGLLTHLIYE
ncbi:MAG: hypothetical protein B7Y15_04525 [Bacteroidetes bacterium 24-39-8]|jgi:uncharacterized protein (DUF1015 family)|nr:MAG: hypothetical protein B7Y69_03735 [Sphingobacteriia bacterium 35-40-8]OYZ51831.1 MAG: hypothetical protein B7Y15_04525 [Bacteroidetes bacterium 24-39-8]HQR92532.1 DUF1015 family protein [Sediminibacterium sp.]HQS53726.1 DUF1015 family protein [Sediminibacterium sp.]